MRKRVDFRKLGRTAEHRWAMLRTMVTQLIQHERIQTTTPKAKELRRVADKMVTLAKGGERHHRNQAMAVIRDQTTLDKLFGPFAERYREREGGFTRVLKMHTRRGDGADLSIIEFVDRDGELRIPRPPSSRTINGQVGV